MVYSLAPRLFDEIHYHLLANTLDLPHIPLTMGIFGPSGDGKTSGVAEALKRLGVRQERISAADLEDMYAGEPVKMLQATYQSASEGARRGEAWCLTIDDIDTTLGEWEDSSGTVNHQQLLAELMHLGELPALGEDSQKARIPIIVTGNDANRLYPPLRRPGRMTVYPWVPEARERIAAIDAIFAGVTEEPCGDELVAAFEGQPLAFFSAVAGECWRALLRRHPIWFQLDMSVLLWEKANLPKTELQPRKLPVTAILALAEAKAAEHQQGLTVFLDKEIDLASR
jgi:ATPase family associated with various cellular activities (AAA)